MRLTDRRHARGRSRMVDSFLLATDVDGTLVPQGRAPESPQAREQFCSFVSAHRIVLAYVSGRSIALIKEAIQEFSLPLPDFAIGDVGTTIHARRGEAWELDEIWSEKLTRDWDHLGGANIHALVKDQLGLRLQNAKAQSAYKQSYYVDAKADQSAVVGALSDSLARAGARASIVFSKDLSGTGLLDILPASASKEKALEYICENLGIAREQVLFAGDSGNDIEALTSGCRAVVVSNASSEVREEVKRRAREKGLEDCVYFAHGGYRGMNGNFAAGMLEGIEFFAQRGAIRLRPR